MAYLACCASESIVRVRAAGVFGQVVESAGQSAREIPR